MFIDGRFDLFVPDTLGDYLAVTGLEPGWRQKLMDIDPDAVVIQTNSPLARRLAQPGSGWRDIGGDSIARVFLPDRGRLPLETAAMFARETFDP